MRIFHGLDSHWQVGLFVNGVEYGVIRAGEYGFVLVIGVFSEGLFLNTFHLGEMINKKVCSELYKLLEIIWESFIL